MSVFTAVRRFLGRVEQRAIDSVPWLSERGSRRAAVTGEQALALVPVFAAVRLLADQISSLPLQAYRKIGDSRVPLPLPTLFQSLYESGKLFRWLHYAVTSLALRGNAYGLILARDGLQRPTVIEWLHPDDVWVDDQADSGRGSFLQPVWYWRGREIPAENLVHIPLFSVPWRVRGLSPITACAVAVATGLNAQEFTSDWFVNGAVPPGKLRNALKAIGQQEAEIVKARAVSAIRTRKPLVLGSDWDYEPIAVSQYEAKFIETLKLSATQIANLFGVPPDMVGGDAGASGLTYQNLQDGPLNFVKFTLRPWLTRFEQAFFPLMPRPQYVRFNLDGFLRADVQQRMQTYQLGRQIGLWSQNEIRAMEDLPPVPGGDDYTPLGQPPAIAAPQDGVIPETGVSGERAQVLVGELVEIVETGVALTPAQALKMLTARRYGPGEADDRAAGHDTTPGREQLHHYWTKDPEGLAKWVDSPHPYTSLYNHLVKHMNPEMAHRVAAAWFHEVFHFWPGSDLNRVTHGKPPRGQKVGPG